MGRCPQNCKTYLQELDHVSTGSVGEKLPHTSDREANRSHFVLLKPEHLCSSEQGLTSGETKSPDSNLLEYSQNPTDQEGK